MVDYNQRHTTSECEQQKDFSSETPSATKMKQLGFHCCMHHSKNLQRRKRRPAKGRSETVFGGQINRINYLRRLVEQVITNFSCNFIRNGVTSFRNINRKSLNQALLHFVAARILRNELAEFSSRQSVHQTEVKV